MKVFASLAEAAKFLKSNPPSKKYIIYADKFVYKKLQEATGRKVVKTFGGCTVIKQKPLNYVLAE